MEIREDLYQGISVTKIDKLDEVVMNIMDHLLKVNYKEHDIWSYMFHKCAKMVIDDIFERFPKLDQDDQRREMVNAHFKLLRKIYSTKFKYVMDTTNWRLKNRRR